MSNATPGTPSNATTEMAKQRSRDAAERTLTSWIQNCLTLMAFGVVFDGIAAAQKPDAPLYRIGLGAELGPAVALGTITLGVVLLCAATVVCRTELQRIESGPNPEYRPAWPAQLAAGATVTFGVIAVVLLFFKLS